MSFSIAEKRRCFKRFEQDITFVYFFGRKKDDKGNRGVQMICVTTPLLLVLHSYCVFITLKKIVIQGVKFLEKTKRTQGYFKKKKVGKSELCRRALGQQSNGRYVPTIFEHFSYPQFTWNEQTYGLKLWDTGGDGTYSRLRPLSYNQTDLFLLVFDMCNSESFVHLQKELFPQVLKFQPNCKKFILIGTKLDLYLDVTAKPSFATQQRDHQCVLEHWFRSECAHSVLVPVDIIKLISQFSQYLFEETQEFLMKDVVTLEFEQSAVQKFAQLQCFDCPFVKITWKKQKKKKKKTISIFNFKIMLSLLSFCLNTCFHKFTLASIRKTFDLLLLYGKSEKALFRLLISLKSIM
ncbi:hypothetical protein RFI_10738 [Reticulomyxa filosa]|uniref:Uncharacterized protein n=1 Tax=Reticulomyxa filosa TaxID=46433 RepID=X6NKB8_RETFI|nr:hypothetical protein RFI_10738 [Reticulomyxa filosa]|eukprot:ETO26396.1 hypothetical protein RFI_10738 [Reticulomyxa filosa]